MLRIKSIIPAFLLVLCMAGTSPAAGPAYKIVGITGLKVITPEYLIHDLGLDRLPAGRNRYPAAAAAIKALYHKSGYILARCYLLAESREALRIFVDEGRLGKIVFKNLNTLDTLRIHYDFDLDHRIYNKNIVEGTLERMKDKYGFKDITALLVPVKDYSKSHLQLDMGWEIPMLGEARLPFLEELAYHYDLEITVVQSPEEEAASRVLYGFDLNYSQGLIPYARYAYPSMVTENDLLQWGASIGIYYGLNLKFSSPPKWTFMETHATYHFTPTFEEFFTPLVKATVYHSRSSRKDLGLSKYSYALVRGTADPGVTLLKKLKIYAGYGAEKVFLYGADADTGNPYAEAAKKQTDEWSIMEAMVLLDLFPWTLKRTMSRRFTLSYSYYFDEKKSFREFNLNGLSDFEFANFDLYSFQGDYSRVWGDVPFYHEISVSGSRFRGFMGKEYYSHRIARVNNEYRISLYRDLVYGGLYMDWTAFRGSGYDLTGSQYGIVGGPAGHFIFMDQFEFNVFYGKDYLFSKRRSQYNLYFNLHKKW